MVDFGSWHPRDELVTLCNYVVQVNGGDMTTAKMRAWEPFYVELIFLKPIQWKFLKVPLLKKGYNVMVRFLSIDTNDTGTVLIHGTINGNEVHVPVGKLNQKT